MVNGGTFNIHSCITTMIFNLVPVIVIVHKYYK